MIEARSLAADPAPLETVALELLLVANKQGWSPQAGAVVFDRNSPRRRPLPDRYNAPWWAQFEFLKAAEYLHSLLPGEEALGAIVARARDAALRFVDLDSTGITNYRLDKLPLFDRLTRSRRWRDASRKGSLWKDTGHDGRALLRLAAMKI